MDFEFDIVESACEPEALYQANNELNQAWEIVEETGNNLFLTGRAGTGKTTFLKKFRERSDKRMVVLAPTGIAAINAQGTTLHSFFQLPFSPYLPGKGFVSADRKYLNMSRQKKRLISALSVLVIDEISMVRPDMLDAIDSILRRLRGSQEPFGGLQLLLIGDLRQLPPVVKEAEWNLLKDYYATPYFFESHALKKAGFQAIELTSVYRQSDAEFLNILNTIRDGHASTAILQRLNRRFDPGFNPADSEGYIRLTTHNRKADSINESRLAALTRAEFSYRAEVEGEFPESSFPAEANLRLKEGAQVMFVKNDTGNVRRFYNGLLATVISLDEEKIVVRPTNGGELIEVERAEWENTRYSVDETTKSIVQDTVGVFRQYPLQLAWAITIHKSQGLTFDRVIIDAAQSFAPGQTYVALSRCRTLEGLVLSTLLPERAVIADEGVNDFINYCASRIPDRNAIDTMKQAYASALLKELFDFNPLKYAYLDFYRAASEYLVPVYPEIYDRLREAMVEIEDKLVDVATRFLNGVSASAIAAVAGNPESPLALRIRKGSEYFYDIISEIAKMLRKLPRHLDNNAYTQRLNNSFSTLDDIIRTKQYLLLEFIETPFSAAMFQQIKTKAVLELEEGNTTSARKGVRKPSVSESRLPGGSARSKSPAAKGESTEDGGEGAAKTAKKKSRKKPKGYSIFETLKLFNEGKTVQEIAEARRLSESTVAGHIAELIKMKRLELAQVVPEALQSTFNTALEMPAGLKVREALELLPASSPSLPSYLISLLYKLRTPTDAQ